MEYGSATHASAEWLFQGQIDQAQKTFRDYWIASGAEEDENRNLTNAGKMLSYFHDEFYLRDRLPFEVIDPPLTGVKLEKRFSGIEFAFCLPAEGSLPFAGRVDFLCRHKTSRKLWGGEIKTASRFGSQFASSWPLNSQLIGYSYAAKLLYPHEEFEGFFVVSFRTSKTNPEILITPILITDGMIEAWLDYFALKTSEMLKTFESRTYLRNFSFCSPYPSHGVHGYQCEFAPLCQGLAIHEWRNFTNLYSVSFWSPFDELEKTLD
jgi:hypothetical protein